MKHKLAIFLVILLIIGVVSYAFYIKFENKSIQTNEAETKIVSYVFRGVINNNDNDKYEAYGDYFLAEDEDLAVGRENGTRTVNIKIKSNTSYIKVLTKIPLPGEFTASTSYSYSFNTDEIDLTEEEIIVDFETFSNDLLKLNVINADIRSNVDIFGQSSFEADEIKYFMIPEFQIP